MNLFRKLLIRDKWVIAIRNRRTTGTFLDAEGYCIIRPPRDRYWADPFLYEYGGRQFLFVEEFLYRAARGTIGVCELSPEGNPGPMLEALVRPYHLSYPQVFSWNGDVWMLPETSANGTIELYRCVKFPGEWMLEAVLLKNLYASDATIHFDSDTCWLFAGVSESHGQPIDCLHIYRSATPMGPWTAHPSNPVVKDIRRARPAGAIFRSDQGLIRPSQDCSVRYGYAVRYNRIDALTESTYFETEVGCTSPDWIANGAGTHTYNRNSHFEVRDAYTLEVDLGSKWQAAVGRGERMLGMGGRYN